jgi:AcrR family transcriptional regulator
LTLILIRVIVTNVKSTRAYSMATRGEKAAATRARILEVTQTLFVDPASDLTLEQVATAAGVTVQTVLRAFGTKEKLLLAAIGTFRGDDAAVFADPPESIKAAVQQIYDDYEEIGDRVIRMLAEEHRVSGFAEVAAEGRTRHRVWIEFAFARQLATVPRRQRSQAVAALVVATDVYVWKLLRRDLHMDLKAAAGIAERLICGALNPTKES